LCQLNERFERKLEASSSKTTPSAVTVLHAARAQKAARKSRLDTGGFFLQLVA
jgi:hypothetical protein